MDTFYLILLFAFVGGTYIGIPTIYLIKSFTWKRFELVKATCISAYSFHKRRGRKPYYCGTVKYTYEGQEYVAKIKHDVKEEIKKGNIIDCRIKPSKPDYVIVDGYQNLPLKTFIILACCLWLPFIFAIIFGLLWRL